MGRRQIESLVAFFFVAFCGAPVAADPLSPALRSLGNCTSLQEEPETPVPLQEEPETLGPADILDEARTKVGEGDFENAAKLLSQYLVFTPEDSQARLELARVYSWDGRYAEALVVYDELVTPEGFDNDLAIERAQVLGWMGKYPEAEAAVQEVLALEPEHIDANLLLATLLEWQGRMEESQKVYQWVLTLAPDIASSGGGGDEPDGPAATKEWGLRWANQYTGDINGFMLFGSRLGLGIPVVPLVRLTPFAEGSVMDDRDADALWGAGGGLAVDWQVAERFSMGVEGSALYYFDLPDQVDWRGAFRMSTSPVDWLYLALKLHTELYGAAGQSIAALTGGIRSWGGDLSAYAASGRFEGFAMLTLANLVRDGYSDSLVTTGLFAPKFRLFGETHRLFLGYKLWFTGHAEASPLIYSYWSPARYLTHHLLLHLKGPVGGGSYFVEAGAGLGHEFEPATGVGSDEFVEENWSYFPVAQAGAGLRLPLTTRLELELGGWTTYSKRLEGAASSEYMLWFLEANLNYRWSR
jgi:tetratricopeptide (TPR) repeat protein